LGGVSSGYCEENISFEHVSNSECLLRPNYLNQQKNLSAEINKEKWLRVNLILI